MSRLIDIDTLRTRCKQRCDLENDSHIANADWYTLIFEQYGDLYSAVSETGLRHFETSATITTTATTLSYALPTGHLATVAIARILASTGSPSVPSQFGPDLREVMASEQSLYAGMTGEAAFFAIIGDRVWLFPAPPVGFTYQHRYIAQSPASTSDLTENMLDLVTPDGEAFVVWGVAVKALAQSKEDTSLAEREREAARVRLVEWAALRVFNLSRRRIEVDQFSAGSWDPADWWYRR